MNQPFGRVRAALSRGEGRILLGGLAAGQERVQTFSLSPLRHLVAKFVSRLGAERLRVFRSCPLITPESASSSLQMLAIARYGCALCLDLPLSGWLLGHARKTLSL
ncbi:hypothetical protein [Massilia glaciei]|uniref:hypothetical protein n=1 Tax=Massilia glaciei TaxID=1524097 RepID=UPI0011B259E1|nr:hypothetical protein [Massilia glaciei]